jgi:hypothetical protein
MFMRVRAQSDAGIYNVQVTERTAVCCDLSRPGSMHYERAPPLQKVAVVMGAASAPLRCAGASLRYGGA